MSTITPDTGSPTAGIQEALDRLGPHGGVVHLSPGEFPVSRSIRIPDGAVLTGSGRSTLVRLAAGIGRPGGETHVIINENGDGGRGIGVRDLTVDGNFAEQFWESRDLGGGGIAMDGATDVTIERVEVRNTWRHGIWFLNGNRARISDCDVDMVGCCGISIGGQHQFRRFTEDVLIRGCRVTNCRKDIGRRAGSSGVEIKDHSRRVQISDCHSSHHEGYGYAVYVHARRHPSQEVSDVSFVNCRAFDCIHGFAIGTNGDYPVRDISVIGCHAFDNSKSGLCIHAANGGRTTGIGVTGGSFHRNAEYGIAIEGEGCADLLITANRIHGNGLGDLFPSAPRTQAVIS